MTPGRYTELFFLDEATGLAAGNRPCFECRRAAFLAFRDAWAAGDGLAVQQGSVTAAAIDDRLHAERVGPGRTKRSFRANIDELPDGVFVTLEGRGDKAYVICKDRLVAWSPGGYTGRLTRPAGEQVSVLTPDAPSGHTTHKRTRDGLPRPA
jgi:hypothetical protein